MECTSKSPSSLAALHASLILKFTRGSGSGSVFLFSIFKIQFLCLILWKTCYKSCNTWHQWAACIGMNAHHVFYQWLKVNLFNIFKYNICYITVNSQHTLPYCLTPVWHKEKSIFIIVPCWSVSESNAKVPKSKYMHNFHLQRKVASVKFTLSP